MFQKCDETHQNAKINIRRKSENKLNQSNPRGKLYQKFKTIQIKVLLLLIYQTDSFLWHVYNLIIIMIITMIIISTKIDTLFYKQWFFAPRLRCCLAKSVAEQSLLGPLGRLWFWGPTRNRNFETFDTLFDYMIA